MNACCTVNLDKWQPWCGITYHQGQQRFCKCHLLPSYGLCVGSPDPRGWMPARGTCAQAANCVKKGTSLKHRYTRWCHQNGGSVRVTWQVLKWPAKVHSSFVTLVECMTTPEIYLLRSCRRCCDYLHQSQGFFCTCLAVTIAAETLIFMNWNHLYNFCCFTWKKVIPVMQEILWY